jgi:hypothetical protein
VRLNGGRLGAEHTTGRAAQVLVSRDLCLICGSGQVRITAAGSECEACRRARAARGRRRGGLRRSAAGLRTAQLIRDRTEAAAVLLDHHRRWTALGADPLPAGIKALERLRAALDDVAVLDAELGRRYLAGTRAVRPLDAAPEAAAFRRRLLAGLRTGRRTVASVLHGDDPPDADADALLDSTHAFAIVSAQFGHRRAMTAFDRACLALAASWQAAAPQMPAILGTVGAEDGRKDPTTEEVCRISEALAVRSAARTPAL